MIVNQKLRENSIHWPIKIPLIHSTNFEIVVKLNQPFFFFKNKIVDKGEWVDGNTKQKNPISTAATAAAKNKKHKKKWP